MHEDKEYLFRVLQAGASSYLLKSHHESDLIEAIRTVYQVKLIYIPMLLS
ncbi:hypothetical protein KHA80_02235 [Anaerobacillus sp. HL2]|nr:hypothetical protein KHA80_02235 [Anaerobacillus sp. HL2]